MKFAWHNAWLRIVVELFPGLAPIRHYRALPSGFEGSSRRLLQRRIQHQLHREQPGRPS